MKKLPTLQDLGFINLFEDRILVQLDKSEEKTASGIILTTGEDEPKQKYGFVIGYGPGEYDDNREKLIRPIEIKRGDRVMFGKYEGSEISIQGQEYYIIRMLGVIALMENKGGL